MIFYYYYLVKTETERNFFHRNPEVGVNLRTSEYCEISSQHTMCLFNKKSESCNITMHNITQLDNGFDVVLLEEHNKLVATINGGYFCNISSRSFQLPK